jgi:hypothetical protein
VKRAVLLLALGGCSILGTEQVPRHPEPAEAPRCNDSPGPELFDALTMVAAGVGVAAFYKDEQGDAVILGVYGLLAGLSAAEGWHQLKRCERARDAHERWVHDNYAVPP